MSGKASITDGAVLMAATLAVTVSISRPRRLSAAELSTSISVMRAASSSIRRLS